MQQIHSNWKELEKYGIFMLTGEACAYGMRVLCDVNAQGWRILKQYFGMAGTSNKLMNAVERAAAQLDNLADITGGDQPRLDKAYLRHQAEDVCVLPEPWNNRGDPIGSIMLPRDSFRELAAFILLNEEECSTVYIMKAGNVYGFTEQAELEQFHKAWEDNIEWTVTRSTSGHTVGDREVHIMSGRAL